MTKQKNYHLWDNPRPMSEWTKLPEVEMTPELEEKIKAALAEPMSEEMKARLKPYQGNSYFVL